MVGKPIIPFFTDQCVPDSVGNALLMAGHKVTRLRDVMPTTTADPIIAVACSQSGHVLVSHDRDFREVATRLKISQRQYRTTLHRIELACPEPNASRRICEALSLIEAEWLLIQEGRPMVIDIRDKTILTHR